MISRYRANAQCSVDIALEKRISEKQMLVNAIRRRAEGANERARRGRKGGVPVPFPLSGEAQVHHEDMMSLQRG